MIQTIAFIVAILAGIATILSFIFGIARRLGFPWLGWVLFGVTLVAFIAYVIMARKPVTSIQISITEPRIEIQCLAETDWCRFAVRGRSLGVISNPDLRIYVGVYPLEPFGGGWFFQKTPASISKDGTWVASAQLGAKGYPAKTGDTLRIVAIVTDKIAGQYLPDRVETPQDIGNLKAQSDIIDLRVVRIEKHAPATPDSKVRLHSQEAASIGIDKIERNNRIWGHVEGINRDEYDNYKVLVYVHTDKWYIHPYQGQGEDLSWAKIKDDGTWSIETVKRKFTANAVAALVVKGNHPELTPIEDLEEIHYIAKIVIKGTGDL